MVDLKTQYMGLDLRTPLVCASSALTHNIDNVKRMEDAGASAVVLYSLFEEQIDAEQQDLHHYTTLGTESFAEATSYFPEADDYNLGPDEYLEHVRKAKEMVDIPVIASLNGVSRGGWVRYARLMQQAGADGLELNVYLVPTKLDVTGAEIEAVYLNILAAVKSGLDIPVAMKLSPFFSSIPNMAQKLDRMDVDALVMFNRFYQPDVDLEALEILPQVRLSNPGANTLPMRWIAILYGKVKASLGATTGIHTPEDVIKTLMCGADATQLCAVLMKNGIEQIAEIERGMVAWMEEHEYESVEMMKGSMSHKAVAEPAALERANYMKALASYKVTG